MQNLETKHTMTADVANGELHYSISGFWNLETMKSFLIELGRTAKPFIERGQSFGAIGDMTDFVPQDQDTASAIRDSLMLAKKNGLDRLALVNPTALVALQYRRLAAGLEIEFFDSKVAAMEWMRRKR